MKNPSIKSQIRGGSESLKVNRSGVPSSTANQRALDAQRRPGKAAVVAPLEIRTPQATGQAAREISAVLSKNGQINDQTTMGVDDVTAPVTATNVANSVDHTLFDGMVMRFRGGQWIPETGVDVVRRGGKQDASDTPTTTASASYVQGISGTIPLPPGRWSIDGYFTIRAIRPSGAVNMRIGIDGTNDASPSTCVIDTAIYTELSTLFQLTGVAGNRTVTVTGNFKGSSGAGVTTTSKEPRLILTATRET